MKKTAIYFGVAGAILCAFGAMALLLYTATNTKTWQEIAQADALGAAFVEQYPQASGYIDKTGEQQGVELRYEQGGRRISMFIENNGESSITCITLGNPHALVYEETTREGARSRLEARDCIIE